VNVNDTTKHGRKITCNFDTTVNVASTVSNTTLVWIIPVSLFLKYTSWSSWKEPALQSGTCCTSALL